MKHFLGLLKVQGKFGKTVSPTVTVSLLCRTLHAMGTVPCPPSLWPSNKMLKPNFQSIISQTNNGCSLFPLILAKLLLLQAAKIFLHCP